MKSHVVIGEINYYLFIMYVEHMSIDTRVDATHAGYIIIMFLFVAYKQMHYTYACTITVN